MELFSRAAPLNVSDEDLVEQFKQGSIDAFQALYRRYLPRVFKRVSYLLPAEEAEDVTQEIFIAVHRSLAGFRGDAQFSTWLWTLTHHKVAEFYRRHRRKQDPPLVPLAEAASQSENSSMEFVEERDLVQRALQQLPQRYREIILLRFVDELPFREIAESLGQGLDAVKSLYRRAIVAVAACLHNENLDGLYETDEEEY
jgi:RNA polymerase sigma-70 factor (ECF subfamily)